MKKIKRKNIEIENQAMDLLKTLNSKIDTVLFKLHLLSNEKDLGRFPNKVLEKSNFSILLDNIDYLVKKEIVSRIEIKKILQDMRLETVIQLGFSENLNKLTLFYALLLNLVSSKMGIK